MMNQQKLYGCDVDAIALCGINYNQTDFAVTRCTYCTVHACQPGARFRDPDQKHVWALVKRFFTSSVVLR